MLRPAGSIVRAAVVIIITFVSVFAPGVATLREWEWEKQAKHTQYFKCKVKTHSFSPPLLPAITPFFGGGGLI